MTQNNPSDVIESEQLISLTSAAGIDVAAGILDAFWKSNEDLVATLHESLQVQNFEDVSKAAHALKGSAINLGAVKLADRAKAIEAAARIQDIQAIKSAVDQIASDIADARTAFQTLLLSIAA